MSGRNVNTLSIWGRVRVSFLGQKIVCESAEDEMRLDEDRGWEWEWEREVGKREGRTRGEGRGTHAVRPNIGFVPPASLPVRK